jgi:hypothetical protein
MSLLSAADDFSCNTLSTVPGLWGKLQYVSGLRQAEGHYEHWGLTRSYGRDAVQSAILDAHRELVFQVLRTPLCQLLEETERAANQNDVSLKNFVERLAADTGALLPLGLGGGSLRHFTTVLESLSSLAQGCTGANRQAS